MINHCANGPSRRAWLRTLGWQARPAVRRLARRVFRAAMRCATLALYGAAFAAGAILMLILIQEALRAPLS